MNTPQKLISQAYAAFNARDIPMVLATLHPRLRWSKAWEGDYATGHDEVRAYWQRQRQELDPHVEPIYSQAFTYYPWDYCQHQRT